MGYQKAVVNIADSVFQNNTALQGALFNIEDEGIVKCSNCTFTSNFAVMSGVVRTTTNGRFEFFNSVIANNLAKDNPIAQLFDSATVSVINNCKLYNNTVLSTDQLFREFGVK